MLRGIGEGRAVVAARRSRGPVRAKAPRRKGPDALCSRENAPHVHFCSQTSWIIKHEPSLPAGGPVGLGRVKAGHRPGSGTACPGPLPALPASQARGPAVSHRER